MQSEILKENQAYHRHKELRIEMSAAHRIKGQKQGLEDVSFEAPCLCSQQKHKTLKISGTLVNEKQTTKEKNNRKAQINILEYLKVRRKISSGAKKFTDNL